MQDLKKRAKKIKLAAFDVDGVMTDGSLTFDENGNELKTFNAKDGLGAVRLHEKGIITCIITARDNPTVAHRAEIIKIQELHQGSKNKIETLSKLMLYFS